MTDVSRIEPGRWGFSRIISDGDGGWTTHAMQAQLAPEISAKYPPLVNGAYPVPYALVRLAGTLVAPATNDTVLLPRNLDLAELTLGRLTAQQRLNVRNFLETWIAYQFTDWDGAIRSVPGLTPVVANYTSATLVRDVLRDLYRYLGHSADRPRPDTRETHNTQYLDDFSTDPATRWTAELNGGTWDSGAAEYDLPAGLSDIGARYSANGPGSIEHEAQVTARWLTGMSRLVGPAVRFATDGTDDFYGWNLVSDGSLALYRWNAGARTTLEASSSVATMTVDDYYTLRLAAEGLDGANVTLRAWVADHNTSKPGAFAWIGADESPTFTFAADTSVDRLDNGALHMHCGIGSRDPGVGNTQHDWFGLRALSDRVAGGSSLFSPMHPMAHLLVR